jgi:hypothetical protein
MRYVLFSLFFFLGCAENNNSMSHLPDPLFKSEFDNCIKVVCARNLGLSIDFMLAANAYASLEVITGIKGRVDGDGDAPYFYPYDSTQNLFLQDVREWENWYEENKYKVDLEEAVRRLNEGTKLKGDSIRFPPPLRQLLINDKFLDVEWKSMKVYP